MERKYVYVISDLHIGKTPDKNVKTLLSFLQWLQTTSASAKTLVLLGDIFDEWIYGYTMIPSDIEIVRKRFEAQSASVIGALKTCEASGIKIVYVLGNHDFHIADSLPDLKSWLVGEKYLDVPGTIMMHGHQFDVFNSTRFIPSIEETGQGRYPLGYFIARATRKSVTSPSSGGDHMLVKKALQHLDSLDGVVIDMILDGNPHGPLIQSMFNFLGIGADTPILIDDKTKKITTIKKIVAAYASTFKDATSAMGKYHEMLEAAAGNLEGFVERFCQGYKQVIVGHIHTATNKLIEVEEKKISYCATGSWKKDGTITGLRIGDYTEFWKLGPSSPKPTLGTKIRPKCRVNNWLEVYRLYSDGNLRGLFDNMKHFKDAFGDAVASSSIKVYCTVCKKTLPLILQSDQDEEGVRCSILCDGCKTPYAVGPRVSSKKKAVASVADAYREEVVNRMDIRSVASLLESASKNCGSGKCLAKAKEAVEKEKDLKAATEKK